MKNKIKKYLSSKEKEAYTNLDKIFDMYLIGEIKKILSQYDEIDIYPLLNKDYKFIQINYNFHNMHVTIDFSEDKYSVVVYYAEINVEDFDNLIINYNYTENFNLKELVEEIDIKIKNHPKLKYTTLTQKKKVYSSIAWISLALPIIIWGSIGLYCVITEHTVNSNIWWGMFFIVIPIIVWFIFDIKSKQIKK